MSFSKLKIISQYDWSIVYLIVMSYSKITFFLIKNNIKTENFFKKIKQLLSVLRSGAFVWTIL